MLIDTSRAGKSKFEVPGEIESSPEIAIFARLSAQVRLRLATVVNTFPLFETGSRTCSTLEEGLVISSQALEVNYYLFGSTLVDNSPFTHKGHIQDVQSCSASTL